jgi:hypothetical protein
MSATGGNSTHIVDTQDEDLESWNQTNLSESLQYLEGDDVAAISQVLTLEELTGEILTAHNDDHKKMLEAVPVLLFQMRDPYKFLLPAGMKCFLKTQTCSQTYKIKLLLTKLDFSGSMWVYPKVSRLAAWSEKCKWYSSLPLGAVVSLFCKSV